jgi:oxygen-dependent protoporphyrinogen oxidase
MESDVAVVGGGISGLACAWALARAGHRVALFEQRGTVGGRIVSEASRGYLMEHGPNALVAPAPAAERLIADLRLAGERIDRGPGVRRRYLVRDGAARALPLGPLALLASPFLSFGARMRLLAEPFVPAHPDDETVAEFVRRRFGREFLDYVADPLVGGLYSGDPDRLSVQATFPQLKRMEREAGSVIRGVVAARLCRGPAAMDPRRRMLFSFRRGLATLPGALADALGPRVRLGTRVESVCPERGGYRLKLGGANAAGEWRARGVVVALPAYAAGTLLAGLDADAADALRSLHHPPLAVVFLGYRREAIGHPLDGLGVLAPRVEQRPVLGMLFSSTLFEARAPEGHVALTAYVGGAREPERAMIEPEALVQSVHDEARALLGAREMPVHWRVRYWRRGLPQPDLAHVERIGRLRGLEARFPGLHLTGNYLGGASTAACIEEALCVVRRMTHLFLPPRLAIMRARTPGSSRAAPHARSSP